MSDSLCHVSLSSVFKTLKNLCPGMREKNQLRLGLGLGQSVIIFSRLVMMSAADQRSDPGEILFNILCHRLVETHRGVENRLRGGTTVSSLLTKLAHLSTLKRRFLANCRPILDWFLVSYMSSKFMQ